MSNIVDNLEEVTEVTLDDLDVHWAENGLPIFLANRDDICDIVEAMGFSIYYLLGNATKITSKSVTNPTTKVVSTEKIENSTMQLFKVVNNFVGRSVSLSNDPFSGSFLSVEETALYSMPAIPNVLIDKLDQFFRLIDAQHGTESIVMLTYDMDKEGPEGWGILVPDQSNTAVHCNYDPDSIAQIKPDNVMIVGSVHSHPGMAAYASGTDHKDQADFDGIHITFGWQKSVNNGATQYHIEMQMAGKAYTLQPEDVFEDFSISKDPDPEVVAWSGKVKKVLPPSMGGTYTGGTYHNPVTTGAHTPHGQATKSNPTVEEKKWGLESVRKQFEQIDRFDVPENAIIVAELEAPDAKQMVECPSCATLLDDFNFYNSFCDFCYIPIVEKFTAIDKIIEKVELYCSDMKMDTDVPVYLWTIDNNNQQSLMKIVESLHFSDPKNTALSAYDDFDDYIEDKTYSVCCGEKLNGKDPSCDCDPPIVIDDVLDFDNVIRSIHLYESGTKCSGCEFYYDPTCPGYKDILKKYVADKSMDVISYENSISDISCTMFEPYTRGSNSYYYSE